MLVRNLAIAGKVMLAVLAALMLASHANAYVGPGAGLELVGYTLSLALWVLTAFSAVLLWPLYAFLKHIRGGKREAVSAPPAADAPAETIQECSRVNGK